MPHLWHMYKLIRQKLIGFSRYMNRRVTIYQSKRSTKSQLTLEIINLLANRRLQYCIRHFENSSQSDFMLDVHRDLAVIIDRMVPMGHEEWSACPILTAHINVLNHIIAYCREVDENGFEILEESFIPDRIAHALCIANQIDVDTFMNTSMKEIINLDDKKLKRRHCKWKNLKSSGNTHTINPGKNRHLWHASKRAK